MGASLLALAKSIYYVKVLMKPTCKLYQDTVFIKSQDICCCTCVCVASVIKVVYILNTQKPAMSFNSTSCVCPHIRWRRVCSSNAFHSNVLGTICFNC